MFSSRGSVPSEPNLLSLERSRLASRGVSLLDLTLSNPTRAGIFYDADGILGALADRTALVYEPEPFGPLPAREAVSRESAANGLPIEPSQIVLTASTSEAYAFLFKLLCDPGDEVLVPVPSYPLFEHLARFENVVPVAYTLGFDGSWFIDFDRLKSLISPRTRAILVVSPNNPTGSYLRYRELQQLAALGLPIISDEVFSSYSIARPLDAARSALQAEAPLVVTLSGLSKLAGLPQLKLAWILVHGTPPLLSEALRRLELIADAYLSPSAPVLRALPALLRLRQPSESQILERVRKNASHARSRFSDSPISALPVEGGWTSVLRLPRIQSEENWALGLLREASVITQPGYFYDFPEEAYLVVSLLAAEADFARGLDAIARHVEAIAC
jgi:aspartate/methionine/tyrosine aminotransferase